MTPQPQFFFSQYGLDRWLERWPWLQSALQRRKELSPPHTHAYTRSCNPPHTGFYILHSALFISAVYLRKICRTVQKKHMLSRAHIPLKTNQNSQHDTEIEHWQAWIFMWSRYLTLKVITEKSGLRLLNILWFWYPAENWKKVFIVCFAFHF